ncbi:MAG: hypothetical protein HOW97_02920 [Catenulispora sp.]|nr:hypothetical protein [Catenulispora sp.]
MSTATAADHDTGTDDADDEQEMTVEITVTEEVTYTFTSTFHLTAEEAAEADGLSDGELAAWLEENEELWLDDLDPTGAGGYLDINERSVDAATRVSPETTTATETEH